MPFPAVSPFPCSRRAKGALSLLTVEFHSGKPLASRSKITDIEIRLNLCTVGAATNQIARGPSAEQHSERIDHDRLACAGLAGDDVEARAQIQSGLLNNSKVVDSEFDQHVYRIIGSRARVARVR